MTCAIFKLVRSGSLGIPARRGHLHQAVARRYYQVAQVASVGYGGSWGDPRPSHVTETTWRSTPRVGNGNRADV